MSVALKRVSKEWRHTSTLRPNKLAPSAFEVMPTVLWDHIIPNSVTLHPKAIQRKQDVVLWPSREQLEVSAQVKAPWCANLIAWCGSTTIHDPGCNIRQGEKIEGLRFQCNPHSLYSKDLAPVGLEFVRITQSSSQQNKVPYTEWAESGGASLASKSPVKMLSSAAFTHWWCVHAHCWRRGGLQWDAENGF